MDAKVTLQTVIDLSAGKVEGQKLRQLVRRLETILGVPLAEHPFDDPIIIRRQLVTHLRSEGVSAGTIQSLEQFFMGIVRRAAVEGAIPAPPEGPWTQAWQAVLVSCLKHRSWIRILAAWATDQGLEPTEVGEAELRSWRSKSACDSKTISELRNLLLKTANPSERVMTHSNSLLTNRLQAKATRGSVRAGHE